MTASVTFRTETAGLRPDFDHGVVHGRRGLFSGEEFLSPRSKQINARELRRFRCRWNDAPKGQAVQLRAAFRDAFGITMPMNYTPIGLTDASALEVQFAGAPTIRQTGANTYDLECELVEVR